MEETATHISAPTPDSASDKLKLIEDRLDITPQGLEFCFERKEFLKVSSLVMLFDNNLSRMYKGIFCRFKPAKM